MTVFTETVLEAVEEVRIQFAPLSVQTDPDGNGGAFVVIDGIDPGPAYVQDRTWLGFHIGPMCPDADVYPLYTGELVRADEAQHVPPITSVQGGWRDRPALQISRRTNNRNPLVDTPAMKAEGLIAWLAEQ